MKHRHKFKFLRRNMTWYEWACECGETCARGCNTFWQGWRCDPPWIFDYPPPTHTPVRRELNEYLNRGGSQ